ncbi:MAG: gamma-glutamylcyclotransferase [Planctomycetaceae bacterium]|nr:gamma-glutamylcyclotransferase [Planctomycetaceae bacterium]
MIRLFVYGTLKRGCSRERFLQGQKCLGAAMTRPGYCLYDNGSYPAMVREPGADPVQGELWEVDEACVEQLDQVEGVPTLYQREIVELVAPFSQPAETYLYQQSVSDWIAMGSYWPAKSNNESLPGP